MVDRTDLDTIQALKRVVSVKFRTNPMFRGAGIGTETKNGVSHYHIHIYIQEEIPPNMKPLFPDEIEGVPIEYILQGNIEAKKY